ncbi:hypothetical protein Hanom_Chr12g01098311 [Helianthus anomalus]
MSPKLTKKSTKFERRHVPRQGQSQKGGGCKKTSHNGGGSKMDEFIAQFKADTEVTAQKANTKEREVEERVWLKNEKNEYKDWEIMTTDINSYPKEDRANLRKMKEKIVKKWSY